MFSCVSTHTINYTTGQQVENMKYTKLAKGELRLLLSVSYFEYSMGIKRKLKDPWPEVADVQFLWSIT